MRIDCALKKWCVLISGSIFFNCIIQNSTFGQKSTEYVAGANVNLGFCKMTWKANRLNSRTSINEKCSAWNTGLGLTVQRPIFEGKAIGLRYEYGLAAIASTTINLAQKIQDQHLLFCYSVESNRNNQRHLNFIQRIYLGGTRLRAVNTDHYLLGYTTPYVLITRWNGMLLGYDIGMGSQFFGTDCRIQLSTSIRLSMSSLEKAWRINDKFEYDANGGMRSIYFGLNVSFLYLKGSGKRISPTEETPISR